MKFSESIFKAYDIRGKVPEELTPEIAQAIARAMSDILPAGEVAVGRDMRPDSHQLARAVIKGFVMQGRKVIDLGMISSDMMYFAVGKLGLSGGAMITASHNPGEYNGIKLTGSGVAPIGQDTGLSEIKDIIARDGFKPVRDGGRVLQKDILEEWVRHAVRLSPSLRDLHIGYDAGNGMAGIFVSELRKQTPLHIEGLYLRPDGTFPNHPANPLVFDNLKDLMHLVRTKALDCGIAFDGDGDRAFLVDEKGDVLTGSILAALIIQKILTQNPGATILYNAITSNIVPDTINKMGGKAIRTKVGHSFIKAEMKKHDATFACEHSGHFYFNSNYNADSGLIAALTALGIISESTATLSQLCESLRKKYFNSGEINFQVQNIKQAIGAISQAFSDGKQDTLDGLTVTYAEWWMNIRASNTEPLLRLNVESSDEDVLRAQLKKIKKIIEKYID